LTLKDVDKFGLVAFIAAAEKEGPVDDDGGGPGRAGKSSLDIVNSLVSMAGCFTIPTIYDRKKLIMLLNVGENRVTFDNLTN